jgi:hypothetical protein
VTVQLRVRNVDLKASSTNFEILIAFYTFNVEFSSRQSSPNIGMTRNLEGGLEVIVRGFQKRKRRRLRLSL